MKNEKIFIIIIALTLLTIIILSPKKVDSLFLDSKEEEITYLAIQVNLDDDIELTRQQEIEKVIEVLNQYYCVRWIRRSDAYDEGVSLFQATGNYNWGPSITITKDNYTFISGKVYKIITSNDKNLYNDLKSLAYKFK